jgi:NhaP-type Na+/H+ and K+/H+ antiporter
MKIKGIKRGNFIELSEETSLEDGTQVAIEISDSSLRSSEQFESEAKASLNQDHDLTNLWNRERQQATLDLLNSWEEGDSQEQQETFSALKNLDNERARKLFTETDCSS